MKHFRWMVLLCAAYAALSLSLGRFTGVDEIAFKAAGREWARSGHFAAPELAGFLNLKPPVEQVWFAQPPVYTLLFGAWTKVVGFSPLKSEAFDVAIHLALVFCVFLFGRQMSQWRGSQVGVLAATAMLPLAEPGRPEELAALFGLTALFGMRARIFRSVGYASAFLLALAVFTNPIVGVAYGLLAASVGSPGQRPGFSGRSIRVAGRAGFLVALAVGCLFLWRSQLLEQFWEHARRQTAEPFRWAIPAMWPYAAPWLIWAAAGVAFTLLDLARSRAGASGDRAFKLTAVAVTLGCLLALPAKPYYMVGFAPLWCVFLAELCLRPTSWARSSIRLAGLAVMAAIASAWWLKDVYVMATLPPGQTLSDAMSVIRRLIPKGSTVLSSGYWSSMGNDYRYLSAIHGSPDLGKVRFAILSGNGSGQPGLRQRLAPPLEEWLESRCVMIHDGLRESPTTLLGHRITRSAWGFGSEIFRCGGGLGNRAPVEVELLRLNR